MTGRVVVVIEDDPDIAALVAEMIGELGHQVSVHADLGDGLTRPDAELVITDLVAVRSYDEQSAREWIAHVRTAFPNASVIVSTAHAPAADAGPAALGADAVLTKPFDIGVFAETVESLLDR